MTAHHFVVINISPALKDLLTSQLRSLLVVALVLSLGVGTTVIQVVAWATMIPTQLAQTGSITEAVANTFDGEHACPMCDLAAAKRESEETPSPKSPESEKKKAKSPYTLYRIPLVRCYPPQRASFPPPSSSPHYTSQTYSPDTPPPQHLS